MDNYGNMMQSNMEYSNIVYGGTQIQQQHPPQHHEMVPQGHDNNIYQQHHQQPHELENQNVLVQQQHIENVQAVVTQETLQQPPTQHFEPNIDQITETTSNSNEVQDETTAVEVATAETAVENNESVEETDVSVKSEVKTEEEPVAAELPPVPAPAAVIKQKDDDIDPNQCRCCTTTTGLVDIFMIEDTLRFSDKIILICPSVKIAKNDYLPHFICESCLSNLKTAYNFKVLCEQTDQELRKKLKRGKNKARRPTEFIMIDCNEASESDNDEPADDDEFHVSGSLSEAGSSDSSFTINKKKKAATRPKRRPPARSNRKPPPAPPVSSAKKKNNTTPRTGGRATRNTRAVSPEVIEPKRARREIVLIKATEESDDEDDAPLKSRSKVSRAKPTKPTKPVKPSPSGRNNSAKPAATPVEKPLGDGSKPYNCPFCDKCFNSPAVLRDHKKLHEDNKPFACNGCQKQFKQKKNYNAHVNRHRDEKGNLTCGGKKAVVSSTEKKKKSEFEMSNFGRDLFKSVAPLTTTYWSDSFSD